MIFWVKKGGKIVIFDQFQGDKTEYSYYCVYTAFHAIIDGKCAYFNILQFFEIIENIQSGVYLSEKYNLTKRLMPSVDAFLFKNKILRINENVFKNLETPMFLKKANESDSNRKFLVNQVTFTSKLRRFKIEKEKLEKLIKIAKKENVKFAGVLNIILAIATKMLLKKHNQGDETSIVIANSITLRHNFCNSKNKIFDFLLNEFEHANNMQVGCFVNVFYSVMSENCHLPSEWRNSFWNLAKQNSLEMHSRLENEENFYEIDWSSFEKHDLRYHFLLTSLGILPPKLRDCEKIRIEEFYVSSYFKSGKRFGFFNANTINDELYLTFSYYSKFMSDLIVEEYIQLIYFVVNLIAE